jgi:NAD(P)-dependent dehydrogenase (short-subunit alcohol dehydrogenase family)
MAADSDHQAGNSDTAYHQRHVLLTGGSSGIGLQGAQQLLDAGHRLTLLCRDAATGGRLAHQYLQLSPGRGCIGEQTTALAA